MNKETYKKVVELLQERYDIMKAFENKADVVYFDGMVDMLSAIGYEVVITDGVVKLLKW